MPRSQPELAVHRQACLRGSSAQAAHHIGIEREVQHLSAGERQTIRQARSKPITDAMHAWLVLQRQSIPDGTSTARAMEYSLKRWGALTRFVDDPQLPIDTTTGSRTRSALLQ